MKSKNAASFPEETSTDEEDLPEGWEIKKLKDITKKVPTIKPESEPERIFGYVDISSIDNETNQIVDFKKIRGEDAPSRARQSIQPNDVLFSNVRTYLRNIAIVPDDLDVQVCSTGFTILRSNGSIVPKFLFYYTLTNDFINGVTPQQTGSQYPATTDRVVKDATIPLPPLAEQQRIVARVEALLTHVNAARERLSRVPLIMKRFRQAVLAAACSGRLTDGWREANPDVETASLLVEKIIKSHNNDVKAFGGKAGTPTEGVHDISEVEIPDSWTICELKYLSKPGKSITYGILKPGQDIQNGIPYIRVADFPNNKLNLKAIRRTTPEIAANYKRSTLSTDDLLLSIRGTVGRVCHIPQELNGGNITQDSVRISVHDSISRKYIELYLQTPSVQKRFESAIKGVAIRGVNVGDVRVLQVALPPLAEQHEIVRRVGLLFERVDAFDREVVLASRRCERLTQALLGKAFAGKL